MREEQLGVVELKQVADPGLVAPLGQSQVLFGELDRLVGDIDAFTVFVRSEIAVGHVSGHFELEVAQPGLYFPQLSGCFSHLTLGFKAGKEFPVEPGGDLPLIR